MKAQYNVLHHIIDLYFYDYKLVTQVDELGHNERNSD